MKKISIKFFILINLVMLVWLSSCTPNSENTNPTISHTQALEIAEKRLASENILNLKPSQIRASDGKLFVVYSSDGCDTIQPSCSPDRRVHMEISQSTGKILEFSRVGDGHPTSSGRSRGPGK